jgi:hypothetical protein
MLLHIAFSGRWRMFERFDRPVRCRDGHVFTTIWIPLASVKAVRLGPRRYQRCPVGHHWSMVESLVPGTADAGRAAAVHDLRLP